jgi:hypothetical protein
MYADTACITGEMATSCVLAVFFMTHHPSLITYHPSPVTRHPSLIMGRVSPIPEQWCLSDR